MHAWLLIVLHPATHILHTCRSLPMQAACGTKGAGGLSGGLQQADTVNTTMLDIDALRIVQQTGL
jgi:hypothetical protein